MRGHWLLTACMSGAAVSMRVIVVLVDECDVHTVKVSHPFSTFLSCASLNVEGSTELNLATGGAGGNPGLLRVKSCLTAGGRCFTTIVADSSTNDFGEFVIL